MTNTNDSSAPPGENSLTASGAPIDLQSYGSTAREPVSYVEHLRAKHRRRGGGALERFEQGLSLGRR